MNRHSGDVAPAARVCTISHIADSLICISTALPTTALAQLTSCVQDRTGAVAKAAFLQTVASTDEVQD